MKALVLSGRIEEYFQFLKDKGFNREDYQFIGTPDKIMAIKRGMDVYLVGSYRKRKDWNFIEAILKAKGAIFHV